jgi:hypothetical protein
LRLGLRMDKESGGRVILKLNMDFSYVYGQAKGDYVDKRGGIFFFFFCLLCFVAEGKLKG